LFYTRGKKEKKAEKSGKKHVLSVVTIENAYSTQGIVNHNSNCLFWEIDPGLFYKDILSSHIV